MNNITTDGSWDWSRVIHVPVEPDRTESFLLRPGDVLFNNTNSQELVGKTALFTGYPEPITFSNHFSRLRSGPEIDPSYLAMWLHRQWQSGYFVRASTRWVGQAAFGTAQLVDLKVPIPGLVQQRRIATSFAAQLALADHAKVHARRREESCDALVAQVLLAAVLSTGGRPTAKLSSVAEMRTSPSVTSDGELLVRTVTSGCLTPAGFRFDRQSTGRMSTDAARLGIVQPGEVLVARSNTADLVGRAAIYPGGPDDLVATDLVFRIAPDPAHLLPHYLAMYLAGLQLIGYWRDRSSGASSTMKKITKGLLMDLDLPLPALADQRRITRQLEERLQAIDRMSVAARAQREAAGSVCAALLRRAFEGLAP